MFKRYKAVEVFCLLGIGFVGGVGVVFSWICLTGHPNIEPLNCEQCMGFEVSEFKISEGESLSSVMERIFSVLPVKLNYVMDARLRDRKVPEILVEGILFKDLLRLICDVCSCDYYVQKSIVVEEILPD